MEHSIEHHDNECSGLIIMYLVCLFGSIGMFMILFSSFSDFESSRTYDYVTGVIGMLTSLCASFLAGQDSMRKNAEGSVFWVFVTFIWLFCAAAAFASAFEILCGN